MELPLILALASALTWGAGDFFGGLATREAKAIGTTLISQFVGLIGLIGVSLLGAGGSFVGRDLAWGTAAGLCAVAGLGMFYEAMGRGAFGPVASITSVVSGGIPVVVGLLLGERPSMTVLVGVYVAVVAIWLIAGEKTKPEETKGSRSALALAVGAGTFFGGYFVLLSRAGGESGLWPLVAGRVAATLALGLTILVIGYGKADASWLPPTPSLKLAAIAGVLDASANALYFYASRNGLLSVVAVIASMYPASTILLARVALHETVNRRRLAGMAAGLAAVSIIARGGTAEIAKEHPATHASVPAVTATRPTNPPALALTGDGSDFFAEPIAVDETPAPYHHVHHHAHHQGRIDPNCRIDSNDVGASGLCRATQLRRQRGWRRLLRTTLRC